MTTRSVTYADLDALLRQLGMTVRPFERARLPGERSDRRPIPHGDDHPLSVRSNSALVYDHPMSATRVLLPRRPFSEQVQPQHLIPTRRVLVEKGLIGEEEFDRWLCATRFGELCRDQLPSSR